jgi:RNA polymerase sigma-70 factor (family 1)
LVLQQSDVMTLPEPGCTGSTLLISTAVGHEQSFTTLYKQYYGHVFSKAMLYCKEKSMAEDITQHVFLVVWSKGIALARIEKLESWLWTVTRNHAISILRKEAYRRTYMNYLQTGLEQKESSPLQMLLNKQKAERIEKIINTLTSRQQQVYRLNRNEGMTYAAIAKILRLSPDTVKEYMSNALKTIREMLLRHKDEILINLT